MYLLMNLAEGAKQKDSSNFPTKKTVQLSGNVHFHGQFFWWHLVCIHQLIFFIPLGELLQSWSMCFLCKKLIAGSVEFLNTNLRPWTFRSFVKRKERLKWKLVCLGHHRIFLNYRYGIPQGLNKNWKMIFAPSLGIAWGGRRKLGFHKVNANI